MKGKGSSALDNMKETIHGAFSSKLFVDECDLNSKFEAFREIEKMFLHETEVLADMTKSLEGEQG